MNTLHELVQRGLSTREIAKELGISQTAARYRLSKENLKTKQAEEIFGLTEEEREARRKFKVKEAQTAAIRRKRIFVWEYLLQHPCVDCGESDPVVLDFDHIDASSKSENICRIVTSGRSLKTLTQEIEKCEIRCSNCHRRRTASQFGYYAYVSPIPPKDLKG